MESIRIKTKQNKTKKNIGNKAEHTIWHYIKQAAYNESSLHVFMFNVYNTSAIPMV